jgi:hypothetical protein
MEKYKVVKEINLEDTNDFWNVDEKHGFKKFRASDGYDYKVWIGDPNEKCQKNWWYTIDNQQQTAETLAKVRADLTKLLVYLEKNPDLWIQHPIAFGIYHTFDLHLNNSFEYLEMRPNQDGIIGLNKPKKITVIKAEIDPSKTIDYELGTKRNILLTLRNQNTGELRNYKDILDLAIHELTHTTCNDVRWIPESKGGNHREPYPSYHKLMRKWAKECGILN